MLSDKQIDARTKVEAIPSTTKIIINYESQKTGEDIDEFVDLNTLDVEMHQGVPLLSLSMIKEQVEQNYGDEVSIFVWQELDISGSIYHFNRDLDYWVMHGETRGFA